MDPAGHGANMAFLLRICACGRFAPIVHNAFLHNPPFLQNPIVRHDFVPRIPFSRNHLPTPLFVFFLTRSTGIAVSAITDVTKRSISPRPPQTLTLLAKRDAIAKTTNISICYRKLVQITAQRSRGLDRLRTLRRAAARARARFRFDGIKTMLSIA